MRPHQTLEVKLGRWAGYPAECVVACNSGSSALLLALEALRLPAGAEVLTPDFSQIACARAVTLAGLTPVFIDCGDDLNLDPACVWDAMRPGTAAILAVHVYGRRCDMEAVEAASVRYGSDCRIIEDLAEAHGVRQHRTTDAACWSFHRSKLVHGEEGGAVAFRDPAHAALARSLRDMGFGPARDYMHAAGGWNHRLADLLARPILRSLATFPEEVARRRAVESLWDAACPAEWRMPPRQSPWTYDIRVPGMTYARQTAAVTALHAAGVTGARHGFRPLASQEEYQGSWAVGSGNAARLSPQTLYLPLAGGGAPATTAEAARAFDVIRAALLP